MFFWPCGLRILNTILTKVYFFWPFRGEIGVSLFLDVRTYGRTEKLHWWKKVRFGKRPGLRPEKSRFFQHLTPKTCCKLLFQTSLDVLQSNFNVFEKFFSRNHSQIVILPHLNYSKKQRNPLFFTVVQTVW